MRDKSSRVLCESTEDELERSVEAAAHALPTRKATFQLTPGVLCLTGVAMNYFRRQAHLCAEHR